MRKKPFALILAAVIGAVQMFSSFSVVYAEEVIQGKSDLSVSIGSIKGKPGDTVTVDLTLSNNPGINSMLVKVGYDSNVLECTEIDEKELLGKDDCIGTLVTNNPLRLNFELPISQNSSANGVLAAITFKIKDTAPFGETNLTLSTEEENTYHYDVDNDKYTLYDIIFKNSKVTISKDDNTDTVQKPVIKNTTPDGFVIEAQIGYEYYISDADAPIPDDAVWTTATAFTGKTPNTTYYIYGRIAATDTVNVSKPSAATAVRIPNNDATIKSLTLASGTISPAFASDTYDYSVTVPYGETTAKPVIALNDTKAKYEFIKTASDFNANNISEIKVTAENGVDTKTYILTYSEINAVLSALTINGVSVNGFNPNSLTYKYELSYADWKAALADTYTVAATASKPTSTVEISDSSAFTLDCTDSDVGVTKEVSITVTDTENNKSNVYTITFKILPCGHTEKAEIIDVQADCENDGSKHMECNICGKTTSTDIISALGHKWGYWTQVGDTDNYERVCSVCGKTETKTAADISHEHIFNGSSEIIAPATCTTEGSRKVWCSVESCPEFVIESINKISHIPGTPVTVNPTCTETGLQTISCTVCGTIISSDVIPVSNHTYGDAWEKDASGHWHICTVCGTVSTTEVHIENNGVITTPATAYASGIKTYSCTVCSYEIRTEVIPATGDNSPSIPSYGYVGAPVIPITGVKNINEPKIDGNRSKSGWETISNEIQKTEEGGTVTVDMNGTNELPQKALEDIQGRDIDLVLKMSNGMVWTINGMTVTEPRTTNMGANKNTKRIPVDVIDSVSGENTTIQLSLSNNGDFGFAATLTVNLGSKYNGNYANLFYYNKNSSAMDFIDSDIIKNGKANLIFTHASDYAIVIDNQSWADYEDVSAAAGAESKTENSNSAIYFVCTIAFAGIAAFITVKSKKHTQK